MALAEAGISAPLLKITNEAKTGYYKCTTCSITLTSKTQLDQHMSGLKHKLATVETKEGPKNCRHTPSMKSFYFDL